MKIINKIFQILIDILVFIVTILIFFSLYKLISIKAFDKTYVNTLGFTMFEIATGSMEPTLNVRDLIVVKITKDIKTGDIITYEDEGDLITHRVIEINDNYIITKGDANNSKDINVDKNKIVGKMVYVIKNGGLIRDTFITPKIIISITITLILINMCLSLNKKTNQKKTHKEVNIKEENIKEKTEYEDKLIIKEKEIEEDLNNTKTFRNLLVEKLEDKQSEDKR